MSGSRSEETHDSVAPEKHSESSSGNGTFSTYRALSSREKREQREKERQETIKKLEVDRLCSRPEEQFHDEVKEEEAWLDDIIGKRDGNLLLARKRVVQRWIDQGIWRKDFEFSGPSRWKHEDPGSAELKCEIEGDGKAFSLSRDKTQSAESEQLKGNDVEDQQEREREASRPFHRFIYHIMLERKKFLETMATPPDFKLSPKDPSEDSEEGLKEYYRILGPAIKEKQSQYLPHLTSMVTDILKYKWHRRGIWDHSWGQGMPDMTWKHERPVEECTREADMLVETEPESSKGADSTPSTFGSVSYDDTDPGLQV
ncbi:hypothetical protein CEP54_015253 [Fusarium duplospermum]|uniref:Uncharacterized protein n=1 Tax=Fusarium duplospermum TaxID=1325734 RepID=A0A428NQD6_9HYPO|nr:hypothetical protein CEP54_015253 [Fusarium duplospermum]